MEEFILTRITDCNAIRTNINSARSLLPRGGKLMLIVKANAYGSGILTAPLMNEMVDYYGVARVSEAIELRTRGVTKPIVVLSSYRGEYSEAVGHDISVSVSSYKDLDTAVQLQLPIHIAIDSGMNRYGFKISEYDELAEYCKAASADICGVFSHIYHSARDIAIMQQSRFDSAVMSIRSKYTDVIAHIASSGSMAMPELGYDMIRLGIKAYDRATCVTSRVLLVKDIYSGESVSYGGLFIANKPTKIAIIEGGYADGIVKAMSGQRIQVAGQSALIIGAICMDCIIADITGIDCEVGDCAVICGGTDSTAQLAANINLSEYELLTGLKGRYNYVYFN